MDKEQTWEEYVQENFYCGVNGLPCSNCSPYGCNSQRHNSEEKQK